MKKKILLAIIALSLITIFGGATIFAANTATITATVTAQLISVSVAPGTINYGIVPLNTSKDTCAASATQTVTNDGNVPETFNIMGSTSTNWTLGTTAGTDTYVHKFSTNSCPVTWGGTALTTSYQTLATNVAVNATTTLNLQITTPTATTYYTQQSLSVTIQASAS